MSYCGGKQQQEVKESESIEEIKTVKDFIEGKGKERTDRFAAPKKRNAAAGGTKKQDTAGGGLSGMKSYDVNAESLTVLKNDQ